MLYPAELQTRVVKLWENGAVANGCPCARHRFIHLSCGGVWSFLTDAARPAGKEKRRRKGPAAPMPAHYFNRFPACCQSGSPGTVAVSRKSTYNIIKSSAGRDRQSAARLKSPDVRPEAAGKEEKETGEWETWRL